MIIRHVWTGVSVARKEKAGHVLICKDVETLWRLTLGSVNVSCKGSGFMGDDVSIVILTLLLWTGLRLG
jgi:uncharacterized membrane protein